MFYSVLFPKQKQYQDTKDEKTIAKKYFKDLGLELIFEPILQSKEEFKLENYYYKPTEDLEIISYRQEIMSELENKELRKIMTEFSDEVYSVKLKMDKIREALSSGNESSNNYYTRGQMLDSAERYYCAVTKLKEKLSSLELSSDGLIAFKDYINQYIDTERYQSLISAAKDLREKFSKIEYTMFIDKGSIKVRKYDGQEDYSKKIASTFKKFRQGDAKDYRHKLSDHPKADHVEVGVLNLLSNLYKATFNQLSTFSKDFINFDDETIDRFSQEIQFYIAWLDYIEPLKEKGLEFNYPRMEEQSKNIYGKDCFDLALAKKIKENTVSNDFKIEYPESIIVVTGPNQGGKTTYAMMFGQMHYLGALGLSVAGSSSSLYLFDDIYTHFGKEEDLSTQDGKLKDDLERLYKITSQATNKSLIVINEIFSSTTMNDAVLIGNHMMKRLIDIGAPSIIVSFLDELALYSESVVSMMSTVKDHDPTQRTYKVIRKAPDGAAYAIHIASKHDLTYEKLQRRLEK